ncbi:Alcohol dehydrogenase [Methanosarcina siciliae HI350]|nr:Alcohol dehydrogenase [Methanosarcina siciliae HI350]
MAIVDPRITPDVAVNDPGLMVSMPPALTAATGMDALTHAVEAYISTMATPTTDAAAIKAIELISKHLPHGVCNAILLPYVEMYNKEVCPERFADIAKAMGEKVEGLSPEEVANKTIATIKKLATEIGISSGLKELGAREEDLELLAENAMQDVCHKPKRALKGRCN